MRSARDLYEERKLGEGYPDINQMAHTAFSNMVLSRDDDTARLERLFIYLGRIIDLKTCRRILVLGCGPHPISILYLANMGHNVIGVDPVDSFVKSANKFVEGAGEVVQGAAEKIPLEDDSQDLIVFESVLEHVDSIPRSLGEIYRVLAPGGLLYLSSTNRHRISLSGSNGEFNVRFYNWFPRLVKECYVFEHLHYNPSLANFTERPAVHWFSFADLCNHGRNAGFSNFYSILDLMRPNDPSIANSALRRVLLPLIKRYPWFRAIALTQIGHWIAMLKRK